MKIKYKFFNALFLIIVSAFVFASCRQTSNIEVKNGISVTDADGKTVIIADSSRIVTVGTALTETVEALGAGNKLVGVDNSSAEYVPETASLPKVGPRTTLNAEGILSLKPTLVIVNADSGPPEVLEQLRKSGVSVLTLTPNYTVETVKSKVETIARALNLTAKGKEINDSIDKEISEVAELLKKKQSTPKVMFVGRGPNMPNATMSGAGTTIDEMINLAGGTNPFTDFTGFREMTNEAVVAVQPDAILITQHSFERSGGADGVVTFPGVALTPAGRNKRIIPVSDMYFQGFGPGVGRAVRELVYKFHPELDPNAAQK
ncbi:MAG: ABC transporter substrate-binding protein [Acidobacteriota bacterium]|nr:ABC transporter substrate-binding protein [Acidobacteriota bacterium]